MAELPELSDPADWIGTAIEPLGRVDSALRCQVCKEYFRTPMITTCSHTFCSLCIRRCITADGKCPTCRTEIAISRLCKNTAVEELVEAFEQARPAMLRVGQGVSVTAPAFSKRSADSSFSAPQTKTQRQTRSQLRQRERSPTDDTGRNDTVQTQSTPSPLPREGYSRCPICDKEMQIELVYTHLDVHNGSQQLSPAPRALTTRETTQPTQSDFKPLPNINYSIMKERDLRSKLAALGISTSGSKMALQRRHAEFLNMWNANCDSARPRAKRQLLRDLEAWERNQRAIPQLDATMKKDFDGQVWSTEHRSDFQRLIAEARGKITKTSENASLDDEPRLVPTTPSPILCTAESDESGKSPFVAEP